MGGLVREAVARSLRVVKHPKRLGLELAQVLLLKLCCGTHLRKDALAQRFLLRPHVGADFEVCHCHADREAHAGCRDGASIDKGCACSDLGVVGSDQFVKVGDGFAHSSSSHKRIIDVVCVGTQLARLQHFELLKKRLPRSAPSFDKVSQGGPIVPQFAPKARLALRV